jgi:excinuclease UvrABC ATPase subunit
MSASPYYPRSFARESLQASPAIIEHHLAVVARADWIIDLGPGAGHDGGRIVFEGIPADLVATRSTLASEHPPAYIGSRL